MKKNIFYLLTIVFTLVFALNVNAASHSDTDTYFKKGRTNGTLATSSDKVKVDSTIPSEYSFALGNEYKGYETGGSAGTFSTAEANAWDAQSNTSHKCVSESTNPSVNCSDTFWNITYLDYTRLDGDNANKAKGSFYALYKDVGTYNGKKVDVKLTLVDFKASDLESYAKNNRKPLVGFYGNDKGKDNLKYPNEDTKRIGVFVGAIDWVQIKYEFFENGTNNKIDVKGYTTYWDIDGWQGIHLLDNYKDIYVSTGTKISYANIDGAPYLYDNVRQTLYGYDSDGAFTETFGGTSLNRVYTFIAPQSGLADYSNPVMHQASGGIWNSAVVNGGLKSYSENTKAGKDGKEVKVGDEISYDIQYTNGDSSKSAKVVIKDTISKGLTYVKNSAKVGDKKIEPTVKENDDGTTTLTWSGDNLTLEPASTGLLTYTVKVNEKAEVMVNNKAVITVGNNEYQVDELRNPLEVETPNPTKKYADDTKAGKDGSEVKPGDSIKYSIKYTNNYNEEKEVVITDILSKGLTYEKSSANLSEPTVRSNTDGTTTLTWTIKEKAKSSNELTYSAKVGQGVTSVNNKAKIKIGDFEADLGELKNQVKEDSAPPVIKKILTPNAASPIAWTAIIIGIILIGFAIYVFTRKIKNNRVK